MTQAGTVHRPGPVNRAWTALRERGVGASLRALYGRCVSSSRFHVTRCPMAGPPVDDHYGSIVFRLATSADLPGLEALARYGRGAGHFRYVTEDRDWLFLACDGDRIVATLRYGRVIRDPLAARLVQLGPTEVWTGDIFCAPEYRNRGIGRHLTRFVWRFLAARGYTHVRGAIDVGNPASLRMCLHAGCEVSYLVSYWRVLWYERLRISSASPTPSRGGRRALEGPA